MQEVSTLYRKAMRQSLRDRSYMRVTLGIVNHEAQNRAELSHEESTYFSSSALIGAMPDEASYAGFDCAKVSGRQMLLPENGSYVNTGLVSEEIVSESPFEAELRFSAPVDIKGLTLTFDENAFPTAFVVETDDGETQYSNDSAQWFTDDAFAFIHYMKIRFTEMTPITARLRLKSIVLGYGLIYTNDHILDSEWKAHVSEISEDMPQVDVSVTLKNYDQYFDPDNPSSVINYLATDMPLQLHYGMTLENGEVEWFQAAQCCISEWTADNRQAVISGTDVLRTMEETYFKGQYYPEKISLYELAEDVFQDAGVEEYYIDPYLRTVFTKNPLPRVPHKEALQIIANAGRCVLSVRRDGVVQIVSSFVPEIELAVNAQAPWSNYQSIAEDTKKDRYAILNTDYTSANNEVVYLLPDDGAYELDTGFISEGISGADCAFSETPVITITQETAVQRVGLTLRFGPVVPAKIQIETYFDGARVEYFTHEGLERETRLATSFKAFDTMTISFLETKSPHQPVEVEFLRFEKVSDFVLDKNDMLSHPITTSEKSVKRMDVAAFFYNSSSTVENLFNEEVTVESAEEMEFFVDEPSYGYEASIESGESCEIVESGAYYVKIKFLSAGTFKLSVTGYKYNVVTSVCSRSIQQRGEVKVWENPLISDMETAKDLVEWLAEYFQHNIIYEYDTRGNPELDANDIIYQESKYIEGMSARVCEQTVRFNGALSGKIMTRRESI